MKSYHLRRPTDSQINVVSVSVLGTQQRGLKTFDKRGRKDKWISTPNGQTQYQDQTYFVHPLGFHGTPRTSLTHYGHLDRARIRGGNDVPNLAPDFQNWGRDIGQASQPLRHQRVAFDHNDKLHPSTVHAKALQPRQRLDAVFGTPFNISGRYDPNEEVYNSSVHKNYHENMGRTTDYKVFRPRAITNPEQHLQQIWGDNHEFKNAADMVPLGKLTANHRTEWNWLFKEHLRPEMRHSLSDGRQPGINAPFQGEQDLHMMMAMSVPVRSTEDKPGTQWTGLQEELNSSSGSGPLAHTYADSMLCDNSRDFNTVTVNEGYGSKILYLNRPKLDNELDLHTLEYLKFALNKADSGMLTKVILLKGAQCGETEFFCSGLSLNSLANLMRSAAELRDETSRLQALNHADATLRGATNLLWRVFTMKRPLIVNSNGRCQNIGNGLALLSKYSAVQANTEFTQQGPECGMTPFGGLTHFLARKETELKYPGLAEFVMLTGSPLFAGDALKLGWTDLFTTLPGSDYHTKKWFEDSADYIHNDAVSYQLGMLLDEVFRYQGGAAGAENAPPRSYLSPTKAKWIEEAFADQAEVQSVIETLSQIERIPLSGPGSDLNTTEPIAYPTTLSNVQEGLQLLDSQSMRFTVDPWDVANPRAVVTLVASEEEGGAVTTTTELLEIPHPHVAFQNYEFAGPKVDIAHRDTAALRQWKQHRVREYQDYQSLRNVKMQRHIFARLEGPEGTIVDFEFEFDASAGTVSLLDGVGLAKLTAQVRSQLGYPQDRPLDLAWYLPTTDTAPIRTDQELHEVMLADPGVMSTKQPTAHPPLYLVINRPTQYFSEWAFAMNHQLNVVSPTALCGSLQLLREVRDLPEENVIENTLKLEMRYATRSMQSKEFYEVGMAGKVLSPEKATQHLETGNIVVNGHTYTSRPKWEPRTVAEVDSATIEALGRPLHYSRDNGATEFHVAANCDHMDKIQNTFLAMEVPLEKVAGLGEKDQETGGVKAAPLKSDVSVPYVDFYNMNRHPWLEHKSSWRQQGFTKGSQEYFQRKYDDAVQQALVKPSDGSAEYWPTSDFTAVSSIEEEEQRLVQERIWAPIEAAKSEISGPMQELRKQAEAGEFANYKLDPLANEEKHYDDHFYKWFHANPGVNPNPSGVLRFGSMAKTTVETENVGSKSKGAWVTDFEDEEMDPVEAARAGGQSGSSSSSESSSGDDGGDDGMTAEE